jgi:hypothetical protein
MTEPVVIRDGWRGQYLVPTFILDTEDIIPGTVETDILELAEKWLAQMDDYSLPSLTDDENEAVMWDVDFCERALYEAGFIVEWDDGYTITENEL